jgi:hypothetical protein
MIHTYRRPCEYHEGDIRTLHDRHRRGRVRRYNVGSTEITIRGGKGTKDQRTTFSRCLPRPGRRL